jgi:molybdopterin-synthase adenylyltransferase
MHDQLGRQGSRGTRPTQAASTGQIPLDAELYARNWAFIAPDVQQALRHKVVLAAGVGLASDIVTLACRTGFTRFILADGDRVDASNLNRQAFTYGQVGKNKARACASLLKAIRPDVEVEVIPHFISENSWQAPLSRADIVVNSIDFDNPALFLLNDAAQRANKLVLQPLSLGWGGALLAFTARSPSLESFLGLEPSATSTRTYADVLQRLVVRVMAALPDGMPPYLTGVYERFLEDYRSWSSDPQLGVSIHLIAAMAVRVAVAHVAGEPFPAMPKIVYRDLHTL